MILRIFVATCTLAAALLAAAGCAAPPTAPPDVQATGGRPTATRTDAGGPPVATAPLMYGRPAVAPPQRGTVPTILVVQTDPAGAQIVIDGRPMGAAPLTLTLPAGDHEIASHAVGFQPLTETLTLAAGQEGMYAPTLEPLALPTPTPSSSPTRSPTVTPSVTPAITATAAAEPTPSPRPTAAPTPLPAVSVRVTQVTIPTYPYTRYLRSAIDPVVSAYPLTILDRAAYEAAQPKPASTTYTLIVLENRYLRLSILPELGGRVYECIFKPTGNNEFYRNPVIKPTGWGPPNPPYPAGANWWLAAGGLEWGFPVEEHGYLWGTKWGYIPSTSPDGGATVTVFTGDYTRPYVSVAVALPPEAAYFVVQPTITNPNAAAFRFKWWANAMLAPGPANAVGPDLRFIFSPGEMTVHSTGDPALPGPGQPLSWPVYAGRDLSRLGNWNQYLGFFQRPASRGWLHGCLRHDRRRGHGAHLSAQWRAGQRDSPWAGPAPLPGTSGPMTGRAMWSCTAAWRRPSTIGSSCRPGAR